MFEKEIDIERELSFAWKSTKFDLSEFDTLLMHPNTYRQFIKFYTKNLPPINIINEKGVNIYHYRDLSFKIIRSLDIAEGQIKAVKTIFLNKSDG